MTKQFWKEIFFLLLYLALGLIIVVLFSLLQTQFLSDSPVLNMHLLQWEQNLLVFILPVICWIVAYLKLPVCHTLGLRTTAPRWYVLAAVSILLISYPMDDMAEWVKQSLPWPEAFRLMAEEEQQQQEHLFSILLSPGGAWGWIENTMLMCITTAIAEEFVFRGALLSCFRRANINQHVTAWIIGFIFAMVHFDLYGLIPRWFLGTLFCYFYFWSGSLWPCILAHALNNFMALLQYKNGELV